MKLYILYLLSLLSRRFDFCKRHCGILDFPDCMAISTCHYMAWKNYSRTGKALRGWRIYWVKRRVRRNMEKRYTRKERIMKQWT